MEFDKNRVFLIRIDKDIVSSKQRKTLRAKTIHIYVIVWSFKILITIVLALIYSFCFEDTVSLSLIPIKRDDFCQIPLYNRQHIFKIWKLNNFPFICRNFNRDWLPTKMATETVKGSTYFCSCRYNNPTKRATSLVGLENSPLLPANSLGEAKLSSN